MSYESERGVLIRQAGEKISNILEKYKDSPVNGRDGLCAAEEKKVNEALIADLQALCRKYNRKTL